VKSRWI